MINGLYVGCKVKRTAEYCNERNCKAYINDIGEIIGFEPYEGFFVRWDQYKYGYYMPRDLTKVESSLTYKII